MCNRKSSRSLNGRFSVQVIDFYLYFQFNNAKFIEEFANMSYFALLGVCWVVGTYVPTPQQSEVIIPLNGKISRTEVFFPPNSLSALLSGGTCVPTTEQSRL